MKPSDFGLHAQLPVITDHQVSGTFGECERMCYYKHILGRSEPTLSYHLQWGRVFHAITEVWEQTQNLELVNDLILTQLPEETDDKYGRTQHRMQQLFTEWAAYRAKNPLRILRTEQSVQLACLDKCIYSPTGCNLTYGGRMDRIVEWNGIVGPLDIKTTTITEGDPVAEYRPNHQMEGYVWLASHLLGRHCWGIIVEKVVCNKSKISITRFPVSFSQDLIVDWMYNEQLLQARLKAMHENFADDEMAWAMNMARCTKPYKCAFHDVCQMPNTAGFRYKWLRDNTIEQRWDFHDPDNEAAQ